MSVFQELADHLFISANNIDVVRQGRVQDCEMRSHTFEKVLLWSAHHKRVLQQPVDKVQNSKNLWLNVGGIYQCWMKKLRSLDRQQQQQQHPSPLFSQVIDWFISPRRQQ
jgi:hypothetical protein